MQGTIASGHVPEGRWHSGPQRGQYLAWHDLIQPLPENDGSRRIAACRGDRPNRVVGIDRKGPMKEGFVGGREERARDGRVPWLRPASLGRVSPSTRRGLLSALVRRAGGRPEEA